MIGTPIEMIASIMALDPAPRSLAALDEIVSSGLPKNALIETIRHIFESPDDQRRLLSRIVPESTFRRRQERLSPLESARTERLARTISIALAALGTETAVHTFLTTVHPLLQQRTPLDVSLTECGARRVEALLWYHRYGTLVSGLQIEGHVRE